MLIGDFRAGRAGIFWVIFPGELLTMCVEPSRLLNHKISDPLTFIKHSLKSAADPQGVIGPYKRRASAIRAKQGSSSLEFFLKIVV